MSWWPNRVSTITPNGYNRDFGSVTSAIDGVSRRNVWSPILLEVLSVSSEAVDKNSFVQSAITHTSEKEVDILIFVHSFPACLHPPTTNPTVHTKIEETSLLQRNYIWDFSLASFKRLWSSSASYNQFGCGSAGNLSILRRYLCLDRLARAIILGNFPFLLQ